VRAADHLAVVSEIAITPQPFIEVDDGGSSPYPSSPYTVVVTDGAGGAVGTVTLPGIANQTGGDRLFVAGGTGYTGPADTMPATFTFTLPANGMACFKRSGGGTIHCYAWGTVTATLGETPTFGPAPSSGQSAQRQANGTYALAAPTPNATNAVVSANMDGGVVMFDARPGTPDGGSPVTPMDMDGGCDCTVGGTGGGTSRMIGAIALTALGLWLMRRRRS
jgi:MYXO-CTERM domain-containing protein